MPQFKGLGERTGELTCRPPNSNDDYRKLFNVNVFGALSVTRAVLPYMRAQQSGTIAFVGSMYAWWTPAMVSVYGAAKGALKGESPITHLGGLVTADAEIADSSQI